MSDHARQPAVGPGIQSDVLPRLSPSSHDIDLRREVLNRNRRLSENQIANTIFYVPRDQTVDLAAATEAGVWDFDGTQSRTELRFHVRAFIHATSHFLGSRVTLDTWNREFSSAQGGGPLHAAFEISRVLKERYNVDSSVVAPESVFARIMLELDMIALEKPFRLEEDAQALMRRKNDSGLEQIGNTTTLRRHAEPVMRRIGAAELLDLSRSVFGCDLPTCAETRKPLAKPHPWSYTESARRLQVHPERAVAVEDTVSGTLSAVGAGYGTVLVRPSTRREMPTLLNGLRERVQPALAEFSRAVVLVVESLGSIIPSKKR